MFFACAVLLAVIIIGVARNSLSAPSVDSEGVHVVVKGCILQVVNIRLQGTLYVCLGESLLPVYCFYLPILICR